MFKILIAEKIPSHNKGEATLMHGIYHTITEHAGIECHFDLCSVSYDKDLREYGDKVHVIKNGGWLPEGNNFEERFFNFLPIIDR